MTLSQGSERAKQKAIGLEDDEDLPWQGHKDDVRRAPATLPKFIDIPNNVLRYEACWTTKYAYACDRYRFKFAYRLDRATFERWAGVSRSTAYRALRNIEPFVDEHGYEKKDVFDAKIGGYVQVIPADVWEVGILRAIALGLLRRWHKQGRAVVGRDNSVRIVAAEFALALGVNEKTARRILDELSTGTHRKKPGKKHKGRFLLKTKGGRAPFILLLSKPAQVDWKARLDAAKRDAKRAPKEQPAPSSTQVQAVEERAQAQNDEEPKDDGASTLQLMRGQLAMRVLGEFLQKLKPRARR